MKQDTLWRFPEKGGTIKLSEEQSSQLWTINSLTPALLDKRAPFPWTSFTWCLALEGWVIQSRTGEEMELGKDKPPITSLFSSEGFEAQHRFKLRKKRNSKLGEIWVIWPTHWVSLIMNSLYYIFFNAKKGLAILRIIGCCLGFFQDQKDLVYRKGLYRLGKNIFGFLRE